MTVPEVLWVMITQLGGSANRKTVKCTKQLKSRAAFVLRSSWRQILTKLDLKFYKTTVF